MVTLIVIALFLGVAGVGMYLHYRVVEDSAHKIGHLEAKIQGLEKDKLRLQSRLDPCNTTVGELQRQVVECEERKRVLQAPRSQFVE